MVKKSVPAEARIGRYIFEILAKINSYFESFCEDEPIHALAHAIQIILYTFDYKNNSPSEFCRVLGTRCGLAGPRGNAAKKRYITNYYANGEGSINNPNNFIEVPVIKGSVPTMIKRTMEKLQDMVIEEKVTKVDYQMESIRRFSYPYQALEEAVVNAFYHRDYQSYQAIIIEIEPDCVRIISYPGIDRSISQKTIAEGERFKSRYYRNKRLGEFLKELDLTEGKSTGIPTIQEELRNNGSPKATFETDDERRAVTVEIPIHPDFLVEQVDLQNEPQNEPQSEPQRLGALEEAILNLIRLDGHVTRDEMASQMKVSLSTVKRSINKLKDIGLIEYEGSSKSGYWIIKQ